MDGDVAQEIEKLAAVGELVNGIAHELNNTVAAILGYSELLKAEDLPPRVKEDLSKIHRSGLRARRLLAGMLSFARPYRPEVTDVRLAEVLDSVLEVLAYECRVRNVEIRKDYGENLPVLRADPHGLRMVFLLLVYSFCKTIGEGRSREGTLVVNSRKSDGSIEVELRCEKAAGRAALADGDGDKAPPPRPSARSTSPAVESRREASLGVARRLVAELGGRMEGPKDAGSGISVQVALPLTGMPASDAAGGAAPVAGRAPARETSAPARILIVDDEEDVLDVFLQMLVLEGYSCDAVPSGAEALRKLAEGPYDLVILDWNMPGMAGRDVYESIGKKYPGLAERVIFTTGNVTDAAVAAVVGGGVQVIEKPFLMDTLRSAVGKALGGRG